MKVVVLGLWHLGCVTAAGAAKHFEVIGLDFDPANIARLQQGNAPVFEPGLDTLIQKGVASGRLTFTTDPLAACAAAEVLWVTYDTPVDDYDRADVEFVLNHVRRCVSALPSGALILLSSQLPVGTCQRLEHELGARGHRFACAPENLRLGRAIEIFTKPDRVIVGCRDERTKNDLTKLFAPFTSEIVWMRPESAEMTKHAINSFLALSITFMNELSRLCEHTGADAKEVERGLKSESRIGPKAYLSPGGAFAGGTLARDVVACTELGQAHGELLDIFPAITRSNDRHREWPLRKLLQHFPQSAGHTVALLGLTYKAGTNTLRRSSAVELARQLHQRGFHVTACDPMLESLPPELNFITLVPGVTALVQDASALVVCTEHPAFREENNWPVLVATMQTPLVIDATRFLWGSLQGIKALTYLTVGSPA
jgi:UDPglucose 6-dehydrogenase